MRTFVIFEVGYFALVALAFVVFYALRSDWRSTPTGRNVMMLMVGLVALGLSLLGLVFWPLPAWLFAVIFAELNVAASWRLWLLWRLQRVPE